LFDGINSEAKNAIHYHGVKYHVALAINGLKVTDEVPITRPPAGRRRVDIDGPTLNANFRKVLMISSSITLAPDYEQIVGSHVLDCGKRCTEQKFPVRPARYFI
jgi:hypothetical protein